jgi:hypothetical protein
METLKVYVGTDRSQALAVKILEYSIKKHAKVPVQVISMLDLPVPLPKDPQQRQRTGFSFSRFCIPKLNNYAGRAVYMDADMIVFKDIKELADMDFGNYKVILQKPLNNSPLPDSRRNRRRVRQCAVMLLNCEKLDWDIDKIIAGLDNKEYVYTELMSELCILKDEDIGEVLPFEWNSLEHYDSNTRLLHYTDMHTQPWVCSSNQWGYLWLNEVDEMIRKGLLAPEEIKREIDLGYFRPSLFLDLKWRKSWPQLLWPLLNTALALYDKAHGYIKHKEVFAQAKLRKQKLAQ